MHVNPIVWRIHDAIPLSLACFYELGNGRECREKQKEAIRQNVTHLPHDVVLLAVGVVPCMG
jgi:hypothetical protein